MWMFKYVNPASRFDTEFVGKLNVPIMTPPLVASLAAKLYGIRSTRGGAACPTAAGPWMCINVGAPVRSVKPAVEP